MKDLTHSLAQLTGLRDRDALEQAMAGLVFQCLPGQIQKVALHRVVCDGAVNRCMPLLTQTVSEPQAQRMDPHPLWHDLPVLQPQSLLEQAFASGEVQTQHTAQGATTVFALEVGSPVLLEVASAVPLSASDTDWLGDLFQVYNNVVSLLDYGEKDTLTELLNRKTFDVSFIKAAAGLEAVPFKTLADERRQCADVRGAWLAVLDIDHFKKVNDTYGHLIGDEVLLLVARIMRSCFRYSDQLYRFGGEEFVVLMRCDGEADALNVLERLRTTIAQYRFPQVGTITASIGVTQVFHNDIPSQAFGRADEAVYFAKAHGRNQVHSYQRLVAQGELVEHVNEGMDVDLF
jgi:diguanylate cyclase (GGDEF)-like protein